MDIFLFQVEESFSAKNVKNGTVQISLVGIRSGHRMSPAPVSDNPRIEERPLRPEQKKMLAECAAARLTPAAARKRINEAADGRDGAREGELGKITVQQAQVQIKRHRQYQREGKTEVEAVTHILRQLRGTGKVRVAGLFVTVRFPLFSLS